MSDPSQDPIVTGVLPFDVDSLRFRTTNIHSQDTISTEQVYNHNGK